MSRAHQFQGSHYNCSKGLGERLSLYQVLFFSSFLEACGLGPIIICHGTIRKTALQVFQIGRGLMQGIRGFHDSGKTTGKMVVRISFRKSESTGIIRKLLPLCHLLPSQLPVEQWEDSQTTRLKAVGKIPSQPFQLLLPIFCP